MMEPSVQQVRSFRLHSHHLDAEYKKTEMDALAGACGMQNTPPGAWETALFNRAPSCSQEDMDQALYEEKSLLQAWGMRGAPIIFPVGESDAFLCGLIPQGQEPWIYTQGITLALDFLQMNFEELLGFLREVIEKLDETVIVSKSALDQTLAEWMLPLLSPQKRQLWNQPSMYGSPDVQTVGGAVVSFLLRPCAYYGLVVFGQREGIRPTFTSYRGWTGQRLAATADTSAKLVRKYLHCYGPATIDDFTAWLGCSSKQSRRMWGTISEELEPVLLFGKKAFILAEDHPLLFSGPVFDRELLLLGGHDPFLDQRDRMVLQPEKSLHKQIWKLVANPGAIVRCGEIVGVWTSKKKGTGMEIKMTLWQENCKRRGLQELAEQYAAFRHQRLVSVEL